MLPYDYIRVAGTIKERLSCLSDESPPNTCWYEPQSMNILQKRGLNNVGDLHLRDLEEFLDEEYPVYDPDDPDLVMRVWEDLNYHWVASNISSLAKSCPTLERVDLCPIGTSGMNGSDVLWQWTSNSRWTWIISRVPCRRCKSKGPHPHVTGYLRWAGGLRTGFRPFEALVGQEMERSDAQVYCGAPYTRRTSR